MLCILFYTLIKIKSFIVLKAIMSSATTEEFDQRVKSFFEHVDKSIPQYVAELGEAVAVPSVSSGKCWCV